MEHDNETAGRTSSGDENPHNDAQQPRVGLFDVQPDQPRRTFLVTRFTRTGEVQETITGHGAHTETGALIITEVRAGAPWTTRIFAPGTWLSVVSDVPSREELAAFTQTVDRFYREQGALKEQVQLAEQREAAARAHAANGKDGSKTTRGLLNH